MIQPQRLFDGRHFLTAALLLLLLTACGSTERAPATPADRAVSVADQSTGYYLQEFADVTDENLQTLAAAELAHQDSNREAAMELIQNLSRESLDDPAQVRLALLQTAIALDRNLPDEALAILQQSPLDDTATLSAEQRRQLLTLRAEALYANGQHLASARALVQRAALLPASERPLNNNLIWQTLSSAPAGSLSSRDPLVDSYELRGWMELLSVTSATQNYLERQIDAIEQWRNRWNQHSAAVQLPDSLAYLVNIWETRPAHVALMLPLRSAAGDAVSQGFMSAYYDALAQGQEVPRISVFDTSDPNTITRLYSQAVEAGADLVVGPLDKDAVRTLQSRRSLPVRTLALNYGDDNRVNPADFFQFGLAPEDEIRQTANLAWQAGHRTAAVLTPAGSDYERLQNVFTGYWQSLGGQVVSRASFAGNDSYSNVVRELLNIDISELRAEQLRNLLPRSSMHFTPRRRQDVDFLFLIANPSEGRQIKPTLGFHYAGDVPVYALPSIYDGGINPAGNRDLDGLTFTDLPWILHDNDPLKTMVADTWSVGSGPVERLRAMGVDSFRLVNRLAQMRSYPETRIQGATGILSLAPDGSIRRELPGARIVNGTAQLLTPSSAAAQELAGGG